MTTMPHHATSTAHPTRHSASPRHGPRLRLAWLLAVVGVLAGSCGDAPSATTSFQRLDLAPVDGGEAARARAVETWILEEDREHWDVSAEVMLLRDVPGVESGPKAFKLRSSAGADPIRLSRFGDYDPSRFNRVRLLVAFRGSGWIKAELRRDGQRVARSDIVPMAQIETPYAVDIDLPVLPPNVAACDELFLEITGANRNVDLVQIELMDVPLESRLPDPVGPPEMVVIAGHGRTAEGLVTQRPLVASFTAPTDGRLTFSAVQPPAVRQTGGDGTLQVVVSEPGGEPLRQLTEELGEGGWQELELDLSGLEGRRLEARFTLESGNRVAGCALAEVVVWSPGPRPQVVLLVTTDTHRGDHIGAAGGGVTVETPNLDALAARGVLFEDCFAPTNSTNPSHIALMTATHPRDTGIVVNHRPVASVAWTLAEAYREAGFVTYAALSTKHLGHVGSGLGQGFDRMSWPMNKPRRADATVDVLEEWLDDADGRPLFVWLHVFDAHWPYEPPEDYDRYYYDSDLDPTQPGDQPRGVEDRYLPDDIKPIQDLAFPRAQYAAEVTYLDEALGRVFDDARFENAVVAVVGDHGEALGEQDVFFDHAEIYPSTVHVPLIVAWPGAPAGSRVDAPVTHLGLGRTLLDVSGLEGVEFPGRSLQFVIDGRRRDEPRFQLSASGHAASVQRGDLYLIVTLREHQYKHSRRYMELHQVELYDLSEDPTCMVDLIEERRAEAAVLRAGLVGWLQQAQPTGLADAVTDDPDLLATLDQLGYAEQDPGAETSGLWVEDDCEWCQRFRR